MSRAESLSPRWMRELYETRPKDVELPPDPENGRKRVVKGAPVRTKVGQQAVHGEEMHRALRRANRELGKLAAMALNAPPAALEMLDAMLRTARPAQKPNVLSAEDARIHAERALGFLGQPDRVVERALLKLGRTKEQVAEYLLKRHAEAA